MTGASNAFRSFYEFFRDGFRNMTVGRTLWLIALIKLFIMFAILKPIFFPNFLNKNFNTEEEKSEHVRNELIIKSK